MEIIKSADQAKPDVWVCAYNGLTCDCNDQLRSCHCNDSIIGYKLKGRYMI